MKGTSSQCPSTTRPKFAVDFESPKKLYINTLVYTTGKRHGGSEMKRTNSCCKQLNSAEEEYDEDEEDSMD